MALAFFHPSIAPGKYLAAPQNEAAATVALVNGPILGITVLREISKRAADESTVVVYITFAKWPQKFG